MATIGFVHMTGWGHIRSPRAVARALAERGHRVIAWVPGASQGLAEAPELEVLELGSERPRGDPPASSALVAARIAAVTPPLATRLLGDPRLGEVDVLVYDSIAAWGRVAAHRLGLPTVCSTSALAMPPGPPRARALVDLAGEAIPRIHAARAIVRANLTVAKHHRMRLGGPRTLLRNPADRTLIYMSRELHPYADRFDASFRFVGPLVEGDAAEREPALEGLVDRPIVYCSLGTVYTNRPGLYREILRALAGEAVHVVLKIGERTDRRALGAIPPNATVRREVAPGAILRRAAVFVTHTGINSTQEALLAGVPMVCLPQAADQPRMARRIEALGAGMAVWRPTAESIRGAVRRMLRDQGARERALRLGEGLRAAGTPHSAAAVVEELVGEPRPPG
ncbi:MAG: nucleotide disphospho-sugar-binding domain-containing protein [Solirubrobacterales bacterium]